MSYKEAWAYSKQIGKAVQKDKHWSRELCKLCRTTVFFLFFFFFIVFFLGLWESLLYDFSPSRKKIKLKFFRFNFMS